MTSTAQGVRRTERYVYNSLHWGFPMLPVVGPLVLFGDAPLGSWVLWMAVLIVATGAGLVVLHTRLRDAELLPASRWDLVRVRRLGPFRATWIASSLVSAALAGFVVPAGPVIMILVSAMIGGVLAMPMLGRPQARPVLVAVSGVALGQIAVWIAPVSSGEATGSGFFTAYWSAFATAVLLGYAAMFRNVLTTTRALERARADTARLAVAEERLRFSRDLHDVFGRTLSTVALKSELAAEQARRGRPEAAATMDEVRAIATDALGEVRDVVRGYRETDLTSEIAGARSLLEASGIAVTTVADGAAALPAPVTRAFAWVVREGTTNILRHADATRARIAIVAEPAAARLVVGNDRPHPASPVPGSGLAGLGERLAEVGGRLSIDHDPASFTLTAEVPATALARLREAAGERSGPA